MRPPGPPATPFGIARLLLTLVQRHRPPDRFAELARDYPRIASLGVGKQHVYLVSHPDLVRQVLVGSSRAVEKGPALRAAGLVLGNGLLTLPNADHKPRRRLVNPSFHHERMAGYATAMTEAADELDLAWSTLPAGAEVDMAEQMSALTLQIVGRALFGAELGNAAAEVYDALGRAMAGWEKLMLPGGDRLMKVPLPVFRRMWAAAEDLDRVVRGLVGRARGGDDVVSQLLQALPANAVRDEAMTLMLAGHETTANALAWAWHLLSEHPEAAARARVELTGTLSTYQDLVRLPWVTACVAETLRLYPPAWVLEREVTGELELDGYLLPVGSIVLTCQYALHRDPRFWDRPDEFLPERWIGPDGFDEQAPGQPAGAWFPFGAGTRQCVGELFAWTETVLVLARLLPRWAPVSLGRPRLHAAVTLRPHGGLPMRLDRVLD